MAAEESIILIGSGAVVVSAASVEDSLRALLTAAVSVDDALGAIVAALSSHVRTLPSLVCAIGEPEGIRLLLRGSAEALVTTEAGEQRIAPGSVSTWAEHMLPATASLVLRHTADGSPAILPGAGRLSVPATTPPAATAPSAPAPAAAPPADAVAASRSPVDVQALASSTLAWLGDVPGAAGLAADPDGVAAPSGGLDAEGTAAEPLPPSADLPEPPPEGPADPAAVEPPASPVPAAATTPAEDDPFGFRHLLDETMHVSTEEAAVRPPPEDHEEDEPVVAAPTPEPVAVPAEPEPAPPPVVLPVMTGAGLIDSVPGAPVRLDAPFPVAPVPVVGNGRAGSLAQPAAAVPTAAGAAAASVRPPGGAGAPFASAAARPPVQAVFCDLGHPNPVIASECRTCRHPLSDRTPHTIPRPSLGRLVFTDGMVAELDSPVLVGRAPAESMAAPDLRETPKLLSLPSQDKRISRLHVEIRLEGWQVYVLDSSSLNGTTVMQPGLPPRQLRSGEPCLVEPGTSVNLGGAVTFTFEGPASR